MELNSSAFAEGDTVPTEFTCDGADTSPPLEWSGVPEGAAELRLSVTDPDAPGGTFTHWLVTGVDPGVTEIGPGEVPGGGTEGPNDFGRTGYGGPCPPPGAAHRYVFTVEALSAEGDVLDAASLTASYGR
jgi:Raf kinase inhibitor-like YbhB/YbcL family protein